MKSYIQNFKRFQPLLNELVARDVKIKYRRSVLGVLWTLLNPLFMMIILSVVFSNLFKFDVENYSLYILSGQVVFNFFSGATTDAMSAIFGNASLIKKVYVPKYLFVVSRVFSSFINLLASFTALLLDYDCNESGITLDSTVSSDSDDTSGSIFTGSRTCTFSDYS